jgi:hypothetical protein
VERKGDAPDDQYSIAGSGVADLSTPHPFVVLSTMARLQHPGVQAVTAAEVSRASEARSSRRSGPQ